ncbi:lipopolysaccharide biosynthesis protein [Photobacterium atrarenae]|uniref:Lipopolysaccharide biosynthesis protein n=1 Tax=Photobacterium atrarenae TaxID=865757 RepID=A0ABY5GIT2_9GAMM|nr:lipopolysaccharide biosynthesis protein [Photobacterium atrarenae]UTV29056.1 lipopolysaccharide biosynthesis protein [Photobacterium atrarenae]
METVKQILALTPFTFLNHFSRVILTVVLARLMGPEHYGTFAAMLVLSEVLLLPASLGFSASVVCLAYPMWQAEQIALLRGLRQVFLGSIAILGTLIVAGVLSGYAIFSPHQLAEQHLMYLLLIVPLAALMQTQSSLLLAFDRKKHALLSKQCVLEVLVLAFCLVAYLLEDEVILARICQLMIVALVIVVVGQHWLIAPSLAGREKMFRMKLWYRQSLTALASGAGVVLVAKLDVLLVHHWLGAHAVGIFYPVIVIAGLMAILSNAVGTFLKPVLLQAQSDPGSLTTQSTLRHAIRTFWGINTLLILVLSLAAHPLLTLYGETQIELGHELLLIMLAGQLLLPLRVVSASMISLMSNPIHNLYVLLGVSSLTVWLAYTLQPAYQLLGVTVAFSAGFVLGTLIRAVIVVKTIGVPWRVLWGLAGDASGKRWHVSGSSS